MNFWRDYKFDIAMKKFFLIFIAYFGPIMLLSQTTSTCEGFKNPVTFSDHWYGKTGRRTQGISSCSQLYNTSVNSGNIPGSGLASLQTPRCRNPQAATFPDNDRYRFKIVTDPGGDSNTGGVLPRIPPGFSSSIRLGDMCSIIDYSAEALFYEYTVTPENALAIINFAIVLSSPGHGESTDPEFVIRVCKKVNGIWQSSPIRDDLCYIVQAPDVYTGGIVPEGWNVYQPPGSYCPNVYKPWSTAAINLYDCLYEKVRIEIYMSDCFYEFDPGYCYIAGSCQPMTLVANTCAVGSNYVATISAPSNLSDYVWYASSDGTENGNFVRLNRTIEHTSGRIDSVLDVYESDFPIINGNRVGTNWFKCVTISYMDPMKPIITELYAVVSNKKPVIHVHTVNDCDKKIHVEDLSYSLFEEDPTYNVDSSLTKWSFYEEDSVFPIYTHIGGRASFQYASRGNYNLGIRVNTYDPYCYAEMLLPISIIGETPIKIQLSRNHICVGDTVAITGASSSDDIMHRQWILRTQKEILDTIDTLTHFVYTFYDTTIIEYRVINLDSCFSTTFDTLFVVHIPKYEIESDSIVCIGNSSILKIDTDIPNGNYEWYSSKNTIPIGRDSIFEIRPTTDTTCYIKIIVSDGCSVWDSVHMKIVAPQIVTSKNQICEGDTIRLIATNAFSFLWSASPFDFSLVGQEFSDTIIVVPHQTTIYSVIGYGQNGCNTSPITEKITWAPIPIIKLEYTPSYIDRENPIIRFSDNSANLDHSYWEFGNEKTSSKSSFVAHFDVLYSDSIEVKLTSFNTMGCAGDTLFSIPVHNFSISFPNVFTPNGSDNKLFKSYSQDNFNSFKLFIYDRKGLLVFRTNNISTGWDGRTLSGNQCPQGTYVWYVSYTKTMQKTTAVQKGTVLLLR